MWCGYTSDTDGYASREHVTVNVALYIERGLAKDTQDQIATENISVNPKPKTRDLISIPPIPLRP